MNELLKVMKLLEDEMEDAWEEYNKECNLDDGAPLMDLVHTPAGRKYVGTVLLFNEFRRDAQYKGVRYRAREDASKSSLLNWKAGDLFEVIQYTNYYEWVILLDSKGRGIKTSSKLLCALFERVDTSEGEKNGTS